MSSPRAGHNDKILPVTLRAAAPLRIQSALAFCADKQAAKVRVFIKILFMLHQVHLNNLYRTALEVCLRRLKVAFMSGSPVPREGL